jgi:hypothetical protein
MANWHCPDDNPKCFQKNRIAFLSFLVLYKPFVIIAWLAIAFGATSLPVRACPICIGFPRQSVTDYIINSDCVVLARFAKQDPFTYEPIEVLRGSRPQEKIDLLVDSATRRRLLANAELHVGLVRDVDSGKWRSLGVVGKAYESVIRRIVILSPAWNEQANGGERVEFFLTLFGHPDAAIRELAYLEMGRAPYSVIKKLGRVATREEFAAMLDDRQYMEWRALAILLLAQSETPEDRRYLLDAFRTAEQFKIAKHLAAWTAAAIEIQGAEAIDFIEQRYFTGGDRSEEEISSVLRALSLHGTEGCVDHRDRIVASYGVLLQSYPQFAGRVAADLIAWGRHEWVERLSHISATTDDLDFETKSAIRRYLRSTAFKQESSLVDD